MSKMFLTRIVIFAVLCHQNILSVKLCDLKDSHCLLDAVKKIHSDMVKGDGGVPSSDPLHVGYFGVNKPTLNYKVNSTTLTGLNNCVPEKVEIDVNDNLSYKYYLACKHLILSGQYEAKGDIESIFVEGNGDYKVDLFDYALLMSGDLYEFFDRNEKVHYLNKNLHVDTEARGKIVYEFKNLFDGDEEKSVTAHEYFHDNWQTMDKLLRYPVFKILMAKYMSNVNEFFRKVPIEQVLYSEQ